MTKSKIKTKKLGEKLVNEEKFMMKSEKSWALQILKLADYRQKYYDTMKYFKWLRSKKLRSHKRVATFASKLFIELGASYSLLENKK